MARLAIYSGNALVREVDVPEGTLRVGRSDQNDIVLIDPGKAVSRFHAELRIEHGTCAIVDLNSQNGTWVAGRRVQQATLMPGQTVLVGTHRLVFKADESRQLSVQPASLAEARQTAAPAPVAASIPEPALHKAAPVPVPAGETTATAPPLSVHAAVVRRAVPPRPTAAKPVGRLRRALLLVAASICVAAAGIAGGMFWWPASGRAAAVPPQAAVQSASPQPVLGGPPTETPAAPAPLAPAAVPVVETPPAPAPAVTAAKTPVAASVAPVKPKRSAPAPTVRKDPAPVAKKAAEPKPREINPAQLVERARAAIGRGDYAAGLGFLQPVMRVDAGDPEALDLLAIVRAQGHEAFKRGRQFDALGRTPEAIAMYEKAVALLPPDHPSAQTAKERLGALR